MGEVILSILTPAVPSRFESIKALVAEVERQIGALPVEHLVLMDNKRRTVGEKRDALLRSARGRYVAFVDDDDWISPNYVRDIVRVADLLPDVITFRQHCRVNGASGEVEFRLGNPNEPFNPGGVTKRNAWHVCAWKRSIATQSRFPASSYGEDWAWAAPLCALPNLKEIHLPTVLHYYRHSSASTEAPPPK